jgi:hypothetical protein
MDEGLLSRQLAISLCEYPLSNNREISLRSSLERCEKFFLDHVFIVSDAIQNGNSAL